MNGLSTWIVSVFWMSLVVLDFAEARGGDSCPVGSDPSLYMAVAANGAAPPRKGMPLSLRQFPDAFVLCTSRGASGALSGLSIVQWRGGGKDLPRDPNPAELSFERFRSRGYNSYRESSVYGRILTSQFSCPDCERSDLSHRAQFRVLHEFSLWGNSRSDYREIQVNLVSDRNYQRYFVSHHGSPAHLVVHYPGKWGVQQMVVAECRSEEIVSCLASRHSGFTVSEVLELRNQPSVKISSSH